MKGKAMYEIWKPVCRYEDFYEVSSLGAVRSVDRFVAHSSGVGVRPIKGKVLKPFVETQGYAKIRLHSNGKGRTHYVHRLVCEAFHGPPAPGQEVCHFDGNKHNNHASNLRWDSRAANREDSKRLKAIPWGSAHPNAKLTEADVIEIRKSPEPHSVVADRYGVSFQLIGKIRQGLVWSHV